MKSGSEPTDEDHLLQYYQTIGRKPDPDPDLPVEMLPWYQDFIRLANSRGYNERGPQPVAVSEVVALWGSSGRRPARWELDLMQRLDNAWLEAWHARLSRTESRSSK